LYHPGNKLISTYVLCFFITIACQINHHDFYFPHLISSRTPFPSCCCEKPYRQVNADAETKRLATEKFQSVRIAYETLRYNKKERKKEEDI
jgi:hypothetical protein